MKKATRKEKVERTDGYVISYTIPESTGVVTIYADSLEEAQQKFGVYSYTKLWAGSDGEDPVIDSVLPEYEVEETHPTPLEQAYAERKKEERIAWGRDVVGSKGIPTYTLDANGNAVQIA